MIEDRLRKMIIKEYGSMFAFSKEIGMANSTLATILDRGINKASISNVLKICKALDISADGLAHGKIIPRTSNKQESAVDIEEIIEKTQKYILENDEIKINGKKMSESERIDMADAIGLSFEIVKVRNNREKKISLKG